MVNKSVLGRTSTTTIPSTSPDDSNLVLSQTDADGNITTFGYDDTGRRITVTDPENNTTHTAYTADGQVATTWGATYPVVYEYDDYDRMVHLHTLRDPGTVFSPTVDDNGVLDPSSISNLLTSTTDVTTWIYEEATGLLLQSKRHRNHLFTSTSTTAMVQGLHRRRSTMAYDIYDAFRMNGQA